MDGLERLAHVGGHEEAHGVHAGGVHAVGGVLGGELHLEAHLGHVQLLQLRLDAFCQLVRRLLPPDRQGPAQPRRRFQRLVQLLFQLGGALPGKLDGVQLVPALVQIGQHLLRAAPVFLFQAVQPVKPLLDFVQLAGVEVQGAPQVPHQLRQVVGLAAQLPRLFRQPPQLLAVPAPLGHAVFRLHQQGDGPLAVLPAGKGLPGPVHRVGEPLGIAQHLPPLGQLLVLALPELGPLQLLDLVGEGVHPAGLLALVHLEGFQFPAQLPRPPIGGGEGREAVPGAAEAV